MKRLNGLQTDNKWMITRNSTGTSTQSTYRAKYAPEVCHVSSRIHTYIHIHKIHPDLKIKNKFGRMVMDLIHNE